MDKVVTFIEDDVLINGYRMEGINKTVKEYFVKNKLGVSEMEQYIYNVSESFKGTKELKISDITVVFDCKFDSEINETKDWVMRNLWTVAYQSIILNTLGESTTDIFVQEIINTVTEIEDLDMLPSDKILKYIEQVAVLLGNYKDELKGGE